MLKFMVTTCTGMVFIVSATLCAAQQTSTHLETPVSSHRATLNRYCVTCHNEALKTAGLSLEKADVENVGRDGEIWERVLRKLKARAMPPTGMPRPEPETYVAFADYLQSSLDRYAEAYPAPGQPALRRLNRTEYLNAVSELLAIKINDDTILPADESMVGFDNVGKALRVSPLLAEQYINAARIFRYQALGAPDMQPEFHSYNVPIYLMQDDWVSEELMFGTRGGIAVEHHFPMDGEYVIQIRLQRNSREYIRGLINEPHQLDIRVDSERVGVLSVGGKKIGKSAWAFSSAAQGDVDQEQYERYADEGLEVRVPVKAGTRLVTVTFPKKTAIPEEPLYTEQSTIDYGQYKGGVPGIRTVSIGGPYNPVISDASPSREKVFVCHPASDNDEVCARKILTTLARRAYRNSPSEREIAGLLEFYRQGQKQGGFDEGIGLAIERILAGPRFIFIMEQVPENVSPGKVYQIADLELATRLSLFLWSSIPDDELLSVAESGRLSEPAILEQQVRRMLDDPRSNALIDNFAVQWLNLGRMNGVVPNSEIFPYFDDNLRQAFQQETKLFFEYIFRNERPLLELLGADYTFLNERLARHYGIPDIYGNHFRKVSLASQPRRGGLLGQGSILTVTSYANRTAPTIRGKWVLENILSAPPPPPPPNIPGLRDKNDEGKVLNMRQSMEQHRANPVCASCHKVMDPLGFALENYDAIGTWRSMDAASDSPIDASGALPDGTGFEGLDGLRVVLLEKRRDDFVLTVVEKLLTYALGRELKHMDAPVMRSIMRETAPDDYRLSSLIMAVVKSTPFHMREAPSHDDI